jgi:circadian clock protein KaiC
MKKPKYKMVKTKKKIKVKKPLAKKKFKKKLLLGVVKKKLIKTPTPKISSIKDRTPSGIPHFDQMTKGGFEKESINLVAGGSGSGKTIFAIQFLLEGIRRGETVLYVTFEEKKEDFYENMNKFRWDLEKAENAGKFIFMEYSPEKVKMMLDEGGGAIETTVLKYKVTRLVIDSITSFSLLFEDELAKRQAILGLFDIIRKWNCTTLLTVQHNPSDTDNRGISSAEFEADSITLLYFVKIKSTRKRFIEVLKMRGTDHSKDIHSFSIKKGIEIDPPANVRLFQE